MKQQRQLAGKPDKAASGIFAKAQQVWCLTIKLKKFSMDFGRRQGA
jgi:hypothetical protein